MCQISGGMEKKHQNGDFYKGNGVWIWDPSIRRSSVNLISVDCQHIPTFQNQSNNHSNKMPTNVHSKNHRKKRQWCTVLKMENTAASEVLVAEVLLQERLEVSLKYR